MEISPCPFVKFHLRMFGSWAFYLCIALRLCVSFCPWNLGLSWCIGLYFSILVKCFLVEGKLNSWGQGYGFWKSNLACGNRLWTWGKCWELHSSFIQCTENCVKRFDLFFNRLFMHLFLVYALGKIYPFSDFLWGILNLLNDPRRHQLIRLFSGLGYY